MSNEPSQKISKNNLTHAQDGFSLIEAVVAIFIMTIGLIGTAAALEALRNSRRLDFKQIANVGSVNNTDSPAVFSGFSTGFKEMSLNPGPDGVNGTDDDLIDDGPDNTYGTSDDFSNPALVRSGYTRKITVTNLSSTMKKIEIRVRYLGSGGAVGELAGVCYLNDEGRLTR